MTVAASQGQGGEGGAPGEGQAPPAGVTLTTPAAAPGASGTPGQQGSPGATGSEGTKPWYDGLVKDADNLSTIKAKNWESPEAAIKSYRELETRLSQSTKSQAPSDPKEYKFNIPDAAKDTYNNAFADAYRTTAHKAGLSVEQAGAIHDGIVDYFGQTMAAQIEADNAALNKQITTAKTALVEAWGNEQSPEFARSLEMSKRAANQLGLMESLRKNGILVKTGNTETITDPEMFKAFAKIGEALYAEDRLYGTAASNINPFAKETEDLTMQGRIIREDPNKAKTLIRAAKVEHIWGHFL